MGKSDVNMQQMQTLLPEISQKPKERGVHRTDTSLPAHPRTLKPEEALRER